MERPYSARLRRYFMKCSISNLFLVDHIVSMTAYWMCTGPVLTKLTEYLALPLGLSNMITQLPSTLLTLQLAGGLWYGRIRQPYRYLMASNLIWRICLALLFFTVCLPDSSSRFVMPILFLALQASFQLCIPAQTEWQVNAVENSGGNRFFTLRETGFMLTYTFSMGLAELWIALAADTASLRDSFVRVGLFLVVLILLSLFFLIRLPAPQPSGSFHTWCTFLHPFRQKAFVQLMFTGILWSLSAVFSFSFAILYSVRILQIDFFSVTLWSTLGNLMRAAITPLAARMAERRGWAKTLELFALLAILLTLGWWKTTPTNMQYLFPVLTLLGSVPVGVFGLGMFRLQIKASPAQERSIFFSTYSALNGIAGFMGTAVCSVLIDNIDQQHIPIQTNSLFLIGIALFCCTILSLLPLQSVSCSQ